MRRRRRGRTPWMVDGWAENWESAVGLDWFGENGILSKCHRALEATLAT